jgi:hypothetical protein
MDSTLFAHLRDDDTLSVSLADGSDMPTLDVLNRRGVPALHLFIPPAQIPQRIAELEAAARALRELVDGIIGEGHEPRVVHWEPKPDGGFRQVTDHGDRPCGEWCDIAAPPAPVYENILVKDLTAGRWINRCGDDPPGTWREVRGVAPHEWLPGLVLVDLDGDFVATLGVDEAVRALVVAEPVGGTDAGAVGA